MLLLTNHPTNGEAVATEVAVIPVSTATAEVQVVGPTTTSEKRTRPIVTELAYAPETAIVTAASSREE